MVDDSVYATAPVEEKKPIPDVCPIDPSGDRIIVDRLEAETVTDGGILLPETSQEEPRQGIVLAVGPGWHDSPAPPYTKGQKLLYARYAGTEVKIEGVQYLVLAERDVLGVIR